MKWRYGIGIGSAAVVLGGVWWWWQADGASKPEYTTAPVKRRELVEQVHASGEIRPLQLVDVGTQVNGAVKKLYADFNDRVTAGQVVAQIDATTYEAAVEQARASVVQSEAAVEETQARLLQADQELNRSKELSDRKLIPQSELDGAVANRAVLAAQLRVSNARLVQSQASLRQSEANLAYTTIRSPVDGVIIDRKVDEGQTVVSSMSVQSLFTIAADLKTVQVEANIPEADIGRVREGQPVTFTVDAHESTFTGVVHQVRLSGTSVQNVVTYPVIIRAQNVEDRLLPGMTANLIVEVGRLTNALTAPNAALRFQPARPKAGAGDDKDAVRGPALAQGPRVWTLAQDGYAIEPVAVTPGMTDGAFTEMRDPLTLAEGQELITGYAPGSKRNGEKVNPFMPAFPSRNARRGLR